MGNQPLMEMSLALAQKKVEELQLENQRLAEEMERMRPKAAFAEVFAVSPDSMLIGELARLLRHSGIDTGQNRLFEWMRQNGYLIRREGEDYNMPTQRSVEAGLFEVMYRVIITPEGESKKLRTPLVTSKGQLYFINRFGQLAKS